MIEVHSQQRGEEKDENVQALLSVEDPNNPVEIVIHVNMLKEGWDVTNLYTIVPLRAANSKTLVEQSIGRGLRLPYGKRTGVPAVDRLMIVSHDRFQEIVDEANRPESIIRTGIVIGRDIPLERSKIVVIEDAATYAINGGTTPDGEVQPPLFTEPEEQKVAQATLEVLREFERLPSSEELKKPEVMQRIVDRVSEAVRPAQGILPGTITPVDIAKVVEKTIEVRNELSIDIPRIIVTPRDAKCGYKTLKFQSNSERIMATILESDETVMKWLKPSKGDFRIYYANDDEYVPDFAVETADTKYICEPKSRAEMTDPIVLQKARAASLWCQRATTHAPGKPWKYLLIPHDAIDESKTLAGLAASWEF